jgi:hypothetical protein
VYGTGRVPQYNWAVTEWREHEIVGGKEISASLGKVPQHRAVASNGTGRLVEDVRATVFAGLCFLFQCPFSIYLCKRSEAKIDKPVSLCDRPFFDDVNEGAPSLVLEPSNSAQEGEG